MDKEKIKTSTSGEIGLQGSIGLRMKKINLCETNNSNSFAFERRIDGFSLRFCNGIKVLIKICEHSGYATIKIMFCHNQVWQDLTTQIIGEDHSITCVEDFIDLISQLTQCHLDKNDILNVPIINRGVKGCIGIQGPQGPFNK